MDKAFIERIRAAVLANRGGWENADDAAVLELWHSLEESTRKKYMESLAPAPEKDKGGKK